MILDYKEPSIKGIGFIIPNESSKEPLQRYAVTIDSVEENAYKDGVYKNNNMIGNFPILEPGVNAISWSGSLTMIVVEPKSRWI